MATFLDLLIIDSWITPITHVLYQKAQIVFALLDTICNVLGVNALKPRNWFGFPGGLFFFREPLMSCMSVKCLMYKIIKMVSLTSFHKITVIHWKLNFTKLQYNILNQSMTEKNNYS